MADLLWPADLIPARLDVAVLDSVGRFTSPLNGVTQTVGRPGSRLRFSMSLRALTERKRLKLQALIAESRGGTKPIRVHDHTYTRAGAFTGAELVTNPTFANGTTGFTITGSFSGAVQDRHLRATRTQNTGAAAGIVRHTNAFTTVANMPYAGRVLVMPARGPYDSLRLNFGSSAFASDYLSVTGLEAGLLTAVVIPPSTSVHFSLAQGVVTAIAGDCLDVSYMSFAPCGLVDNGSNLIRHTEEMAENPSFWPNTESSWGDDATAAPNGATVADSLIENSATNVHYTQGTITCDAALEDYCFAVALKAGSRTFARVLLLSTPTNTSISCYVNLSTGAITNTSTGADWANLRTFSRDLGNGWWYVAIVGKKNSSDVSLRGRIQIASAAGTDNYAGNGSGNIYVWRPTCAKSGVPVRLTNNGATADTDGTLQSLGGGLHTKGWPASTSGLFLKGDQVEIGGQLIILSENVDSDAAGLAFLPFPSIRKAPADNEPVIAVNPMAKMIPVESENGWSNVPGIFSDSELVLVETA